MPPSPTPADREQRDRLPLKRHKRPLSAKALSVCLSAPRSVCVPPAPGGQGAKRPHPPRRRSPPGRLALLRGRQALLREGGGFATASEAVNIRAAPKDQQSRAENSPAESHRTPRNREGRFATERVGAKPPPDRDHAPSATTNASSRRQEGPARIPLRNRPWNPAGPPCRPGATNSPAASGISDR